MLGPLKEKLSEIQNLKAGPGVTPSAVTFHPAMIAAKKMEKKIMDQLEESGASKSLRATAFEMPLFGTGIMKGPFVTDKEYPNWTEDGEYTPVIKNVPSTSHVSIWNFIQIQMLQTWMRHSTLLSGTRCLARNYVLSRSVHSSVAM
jgi:hypothetical protein